MATGFDEVTLPPRQDQVLHDLARSHSRAGERQSSDWARNVPRVEPSLDRFALVRHPVTDARHGVAHDLEAGIGRGSERWEGDRVGCVSKEGGGFQALPPSYHL